MRASWLSLAAGALLGCGRIGFAPEHAAPDAAPDAAWASGLGELGAGGRTRATALAAFPGGGVVVAGSFTAPLTLGDVALAPAGASDLFLARLAADGGVAWARRLGGPAAEAPLHVAVAPDGTIYLGGYGSDETDLGGGPLALQHDDGVLASYGPDGSYRWARAIGGALPTGPYGNDAVVGVAAGPDGVVVGGKLTGPVDLGGGALAPTGGAFDAFVAAYAPDGTLRWARRWGDTRYNQTYAVALGPGGEVYAAGYYEGTPLLDGVRASAYRGIQDGFLLAWDRAGSLRWARDFGGPGFDWTYGLAVDASGDVYAAGRFDTATDLGGGLAGMGGDAVVASWSAAGAARWARSLGGAGCDALFGLEVVGGRVVAVGRFTSSLALPEGPVAAAGPADGVLVAYDQDGGWRGAAVRATPGDDRLLAVAGAGGDGVFVAGAVRGDADDGCGGAVAVAASVQGLVARLAAP